MASSADTVGMGKKRAKMSDQIRSAIDSCGITRYRISKETGISESALSRFMTGERGLSMTALDALADYLGLDVVMRRKRQP
jgi:transcriptional regulator with XRE-family HTH domain